MSGIRTLMGHSVFLASVALIAIGWLYTDVFRWLVESWINDRGNSPGILILLFSAYLLWTRRTMLRTDRHDADWLGVGIGLGCMCLGLILRLCGIYMRVQFIEGISLIPFSIGAIGIASGSHGMRWFAPAALFSVFMVPLPGFLAGQLSSLLQTFATKVSAFALQTFGVPAMAEGNIIRLSEGQIGVAEACSGLQMLYAFLPLTVGACLVIDRTWIEKACIGASAIPIAIMANCIRIIATGIAYEFFGPALAEHVFHDVAGWLMMPLGFVILMLGLAILDHLIVIDEPLPAALR